jgi:hypothetical protein
VTHLLLSSSFVLLTKFNGLLMQFGQFLSHDITSECVGFAQNVQAAPPREHRDQLLPL